MTNYRTRYTKGLQWALLPALATAFVLPAITWSAPEGGFAHMSPVEAVELAQRDATPTFTAEDAANFPACHADNRGLTDTVFVVTLNGTRRTMTFDRAWDRTHTDGPVTTWVIAFC